MTSRVRHSDGAGRRTARRDKPPPHATDVRRRPRAPRLPAAPYGPTILGFRAEPPDDDQPIPAGRLVALRRADAIGGTLLVLAGVAACVGLWLPWTREGEAIGVSLFLRGVVFGSVEELARTGLWQPLAVLLSGGLLFLLGLLLLRPARTHRVVGVLALFLAIVAATGVVSLLAGGDWQVTRFHLGMWCAVAVPVFGVLGAMKAMLTTPQVTIDTRGAVANG
jgi:hypothetical protein